MKHLIHRFLASLRQNGVAVTAFKIKNHLTSLLSPSKPADQPISDATASDETISESNRTAAKWNESAAAYSREGFKEYWELLEDVQLCQAAMMAKGRDIIEYIASFFPSSKVLLNLNGLIIGCKYGESTPAISLAKTGIFRKLTIVDIADGLLKDQERITDEMKLNHVLKYKCMDLDAASILERNTYDLIISFGTVHHIRRLEGLFDEISDSLRDDGIFVMKEYIGPSYLQFTDKQLQIADRILESLPDYLKTQKDGVIKIKAWRPSKEEIISDDPSEAVRSADIMSIVQESLEVLTCNTTGGTLLNPLLHAIAGNFERGDAERAVLRAIIATEKTLVEEGVIPSDYVFLVAKAKRQESTEEKTKSFWDKEAGTWEIGRGIHWTELIAIHERLNRKMSGDTYIDLYSYVINFLKERGLEFPLQRCLTLGCGAGDFERSLSKYHFCLRHDAYDISEGAIQKAKEGAGAEGLSHISYKVIDINSISLPADTYDVVFGIQSVHHFSELEHVFSEVRKSLKPEGFFVLHEFIGPNKFQWTEKQLNIVNGILSFLPDKYCQSRKDGITVKKTYWRPTLHMMDHIDPSEAVRSEDIMKVLPEYFEIVEKKDLGGAILQLLLDEIAGNFDDKKPEDRRLLKMFFEIEDAFMDVGEIQSDFALIIARKT